MIKHYFKIAWHNIRHQKLTSVINISGLSIAILAGMITLLIALATVSIHAVKAAVANPAKSLRTA